MKTLKNNKLFTALMLVCLSLATMNLFAQKKTLHTEDDGFQWYELEQNWKVGVQSLYGTTLIPLSRGYDLVTYLNYNNTGGYFYVLKNHRNGICDKNGKEIIAPKYDNAYIGTDGKFFFVELNNKEGVCDLNGREIIAPRYESLIYSDGTFEYKDASGNWVSTGISLSKSSRTNYASNTTTTTTTTTGGGSSSSGSSSGSDKGKLLYEGMYIGGPSLLNGMSSPDVIGSVKVEIYENEIHIDCGGGSYYFSGINNGKRKYSIYSNGGKVFADVVVDNSYNLTLYRYHPIGTETKQYTRADSSPVNIPQGGYYGGGDNYGGYNNGSSGTNGGNSGNTQTSQPKQHKCGVCGGSGRVVKTDGPSFGNTKYCSECGRTVPDNHYHTTCPSCKGKGWW